MGVPGFNSLLSPAATATIEVSGVTNIRHAAVGHPVPRSGAISNLSPLRGEEDVNRIGLHAAVGLRKPADAQKRVFFDVGERSLNQSGNARIVGDLRSIRRSVARFYLHGFRIDLLDLAANSNGLLRIGGRHRAHER